MGNIEDVREVTQEFISPDLRALSARMDSIEKEMKVRFNHAEERLATAEKVAAIRHATATANLANIMWTWEMEKRLTLLENQHTKLEAQHA